MNGEMEPSLLAPRGPIPDWESGTRLDSWSGCRQQTQANDSASELFGVNNASLHFNIHFRRIALVSDSQGQYRVRSVTLEARYHSTQPFVPLSPISKRPGRAMICQRRTARRYVKLGALGAYQNSGHIYFD